ncbi:START domain-containing protein [Ascidiimonas aurantiaca]|uniref:START domain-containing protein n=1 Tax=Ascidiimonas aurantiaca TaxID=1685432 RepID=UPI0030EC45AD
MKIQLVILSSLCFCFLAQAQEWELKRDKNGIKVYTRKLDSTKINEYKAFTRVKTTAKKALTVLTDGNRLWKWNHKTSESKTLKKISDTEFIFWIKNDLPWPLKSRDNVVRVTVSDYESSGYYLDLSPDTSGIFPEQKNSIRVTNFKGHWLIVPKGEFVEITQQLYGDPGGALPAWVLNSVITTAPYHSFEDLKLLLEK